MAFPRKIMLAAAVLLLAACRSDPIQFHTLSSTSTSAQSASAVQRGNVEVQIETISIPPQVDRQQIVVRQSDSSLAILEGHWWGASLVDEMRSALAQQLPDQGAARKVSVRLDVQRLDSLPGQYALIDVNWRLRDLDADARPLLYCRSRLQTAAGVSIDEIVIAHQQNLRQLAAEITQAASNTAWRCLSSS
ncbi:PqiC family protein [Pseudomonas sp. NyZ704]|nr:PqiC family protein [Pseudomonas sp. NyZ704]